MYFRDKGVAAVENIMHYWSQFGRTLWNVAQQFTWKDVIDVLIVTLLVYGIIKLVRETRAEQLVKGIIVLLVLFVISYYLDLLMVNAILHSLFQSALLMVIILFQPEIRKALEQMGRSSVGRSLASVVGGRERDDAGTRRAIQSVVEAVSFLQQTRMGALVVFERETRLGEIAATGTVMEAEPSAQLIGNVFFNKAPLHDGAMILREGKVYAAGCILPLTENLVSAELGTRHRAALGMSENSDAMVVVVSEETGQISIAENGRLTRDYNRLTLREALEKGLIGSGETVSGGRRLLDKLRRRKGKGE